MHSRKLGRNAHTLILAPLYRVDAHRDLGTNIRSHRGSKGTAPTIDGRIGTDEWAGELGAIDARALAQGRSGFGRGFPACTAAPGAVPSFSIF